MAPANPPRRSSIGLLLLLIAVLLGAVVGLTVVVVGRRNASPTTTPLTTSQQAVATSPEPTVTSTTLSPDASALASLTQIAQSDSSQISQILDQWVPQLSTKKPGLVDPRDEWSPSVPFTYQLILSGYQQWMSKYSNVLLLDSSDYISYHPGFWVVIVDEAFSDSTSVIQWCQSQGLDDDNCAAARVSHTTPEGPGTFQSW